MAEFIRGLKTGTLITRSQRIADLYEVINLDRAQQTRRIPVDLDLHANDDRSVQFVMREEAGALLPQTLINLMGFDILYWVYVNVPNKPYFPLIFSGYTEPTTSKSLKDAYAAIQIERMESARDHKVYVQDVRVAGVGSDSDGKDHAIGITYSPFTENAHRVTVSYRNKKIDQPVYDPSLDDYSIAGPLTPHMVLMTGSDDQNRHNDIARFDDSSGSGTNLEPSSDSFSCKKDGGYLVLTHDGYYGDPWTIKIPQKLSK